MSQGHSVCPTIPTYSWRDTAQPWGAHSSHALCKQPGRVHLSHLCIFVLTEMPLSTLCGRGILLCMH